MSKVQIGDKFAYKNTSYQYKVFDITGDVKGIPSEARIVWLAVSNKLGWISNAQLIISIPERSMDAFFSKDIAR